MKRTIALASLLALIALPAAASQFKAFDREAQVKGSDLILVGHVLSTRSEWAPNRSAIYTDAEIAVDEVWKGLPASDRVVVRTVSGTVDGVTLEVEGAARFTEGEEVLVFLHDGGGVLTPWGMAFGKYEIVGSGADEFAIGSMPPAVSGAQKFVQVSITMDDLHDEVRSILDKEGE
ncbi:MAG: hypothetical protein ACREQ9_19755 [Candidatus Binatia bacterium]